MARQTGTLLTLANQGAGTVTGAWQVVGDVDTLTLVLDVTAAAGAGTDTLDVYVDGQLHGVVVNLVHFTQVLGNGGSRRILAALSRQGPQTTPVDVTFDATAGTTRNFGVPERVRARAVVAGGTASFSATVRMSGL